jgi:hypothetical protein
MSEMPAEQTARLKYTDRDVRENPGMIELAERFLEHYEGEFQFLVDAKRTFRRGYTLNIATIRGVLNCMRSDSRVVHLLPEPGDPDLAKVLELPMPKTGVIECQMKASHDPHYEWVRGKQKLKCPGVPFEINRNEYTHTKTFVRAKFVKARTSFLIHQTTSLAEGRWFLDRDERHKNEYGEFEVITKTRCKQPGWVYGGILIAALPTQQEFTFVYGEKYRLCRTCTDLGASSTE